MIDNALLEQAEQRINREFTALDTLIIMVNDKCVHSTVFNPECALDKPQLVYSVTKSITAALIGIAIDNGYINSVDQTLVELIPGICAEVKPSAIVEKITLHEVLSMTTGQVWTNGAFGNEPMLARVLQQPDWIAALLRFPVKPALVGQFQYNTGLSHILSAIISSTTNTSAERFAQEYLFAPLCITDYHWPVDRQGHNLGGWGLHLTPNDMAKFGQLILHGGQHKKRQIIPAHWITRSIRAHTSEYGYQWWLRTSQGLDCWCAQGLGGQYICCVPECNSVIVTTSRFAGRRQNLWQLFEEYWLPALR